MAIYKEDIVDVELTTGNIHRSFTGRIIGEGDEKADRFGVHVLRNGEEVSLVGVTCAGYFIRSDGGTVAITGETAGSKAYVDLPAACYAIEGKFALAIKLTGNNITGTVRIVDGVVSNTTTDAVVDPGTIIPSVEQLIEAINEAVESIPPDYSALTENVQEIGGTVKALEKMEGAARKDWLQGTAYTSEGKVIPESNEYRCRIVITTDNYEKVTAKTGYEIYGIWCNDTPNGYITVAETPAFGSEINVGISTAGSLFVIARKDNGEDIIPEEAEENIIFRSVTIETVKQIKETESGSISNWRQGTAYKNQNDYLTFEESTLRVRTLVPLDRQYNIIAKTGYQFYWYVCLLDGTGYKVLDYDGWVAEKRIPEYGDGYYLAVVARKEANTAINITETGENVVSFLPVCGDVIDSVRQVFRASVIPEEDLYRSAYYSDTNTVIAVNDARLKKIRIVSGTEYHITTAFTGSDVDFPLISYFDASDNFISYEVMNVAGVETRIIDHIAHIPDGASWFYVNSRYTESKIEAYQVPALTLPDVAAAQKEVSILFVGNSLTQDGISYLPYLLRHYYPEIRFRLYMWYNGGYTLAQQYQKFVNDQACEEFSVAENSDYWINSTAKMSAILSTYKFDIVSLQEYFNYKTSYTDADLADWNNCRDYITSHYTGGNGLEFVSLFHAPLRSSADTVFNRTLAGNELILKKTISNDMIPNGIAVYRALSTDLDSLGDQGHLSPDGTHTQEGLPCLLQTFVTALWLFDRIGLPRSVYGCPIRITTAIYNHINVPGANLGSGVITGTDAQNILAQEVAIKAYKEGKYYVLNNIFDPS